MGQRISFPKSHCFISTKAGRVIDICSVRVMTKSSEKVVVNSRQRTIYKITFSFQNSNIEDMECVYSTYELRDRVFDSIETYMENY
jgi:hypothetical protein